MKILVTGASGYIGSMLVPALLHQGHKIVALDNFMYNQHSLLYWCNNRNLEIVKGDARDEQLMVDLLADADMIIPLACIVGMPACNNDPVSASSTNLGAIKMLLDLRSPEQKVIFPTTNSGYGIGQEGIYCTEETPLNPVSLYGQLKVDAERAVLESGNAITLRLATVFGASPRMRLDLLVNDLVYRAVTDKYVVLYQASFKRNYIHIRDVVQGFLHCIRNFESMNGQAYNLGLSEANLSKLELCDEIKQQIPEFYFTEANIGEDIDKRNYIVSNAKIEATGFRLSYTLQEGITELIKAYQFIKKNQYGNA